MILANWDYEHLAIVRTSYSLLINVIKNIYQLYSWSKTPKALQLIVNNAHIYTIFQGMGHWLAKV